MDDTRTPSNHNTEWTLADHRANEAKIAARRDCGVYDDFLDFTANDMQLNRKALETAIDNRIREVLAQSLPSAMDPYATSSLLVELHADCSEVSRDALISGINHARDGLGELHRRLLDAAGCGSRSEFRRAIRDELRAIVLQMPPGARRTIIEQDIARLDSRGRRDARRSNRWQDFQRRGGR